MVRSKRASRWAWACVGWLMLSGAGWAADLSAPDEEAPPTSPLRRPVETPPPVPDPVPNQEPPELLQTHAYPPLGFSGDSGVLPRENQDSSHFVPVEDRWRVGFPSWDRYGNGHNCTDDIPYNEGNICDPYNLNVLKGDYAIWGQNTFFNFTATSFSIFEPRQLPTATTPFESTARPFQNEFFGRPNQFFNTDFLSLSFDLFHGDAAFKPVDWRVKITPVFNFNYLTVEELGVVSPNVNKGTTRARTFWALQEWFFESKLADLSPDYDFVSVRAGSQPFVNDFRGFIFADTNRGVRIFGNRNSNRDQFNLVWFDQMEKDTNSELNNIFFDRHQDVFVANYYRQDFIWPGYTAQLNAVYNRDKPSFKFNTNNFLVRPDPSGVFQQHGLDVLYLGWTGDGHINRYNITHAFYWALGRDSLNPIANQGQDISGQMAAVEVSYDRDWARFRTSLLWASGDGNVNNSHATGFDSILDRANFGGANSFWNRQAIPLFGVNLVQRQSLFADLRSSKIQGQSNFVNPGLWLVNGGVDLDLTPKLRVVNNANLLFFDKTNALEAFLFQANVDRFIGTDLSTSVEYRPLLNNNIIMVFGAATLLPGSGFKDLYNRLRNDVNPLMQAFLELTLQY